MPVEERDLSSRQTLKVVRDQEIGQPTNSEKYRSETTDSVTCESESRTRLSFLCAVRQDVSTGYAGLCLLVLSCQQRRGGSRRADVRGHRGVRSGTLAWGTGASTQRGELSTGSG